MTQVEERQQLDLRALVQAVRRSWLTIVLALMVGVTVAAVVTALTPKRYEATSSVILRRTSDSNNTPSGAMATEVALAHSVPVAERVLAALDLDESAENFLRTYTARARTDDVLVFQVRAATADEAVAVANTVADEFLSYRQEQASEALDVLRTSLSDRISQRESDIADLDQQLSDRQPPNADDSTDPTVSRLLAQREALVQEVASLRGEIGDAELQATLAAEGSKVVEPASRPRQPTQPDVRVNMVLGVLGGLVVGTGIVVVRELTSYRLRTRQDIALAARAPVLRSCSLPRRRLRRHGVNAKRAWRSIGTSFERAVDGIASELDLATSGDALVVSSVECDAEAGLLTLRLARELAASGRHPLVADLGERPPTLGSLLVGIGVLARPERSAPVQRWFLPETSDRDGESWIGFADSSIGLTSVQSRRWQTSSKSSLAAAADVLIIFTPTWAREDEPPSLATAALTQAPSVLVVPAGRATAESIRRHADALSRVSAQLVGVVVVNPDRFDETTGQIEVPRSTPGPTPLRGVAAES
jgi:capsular polysaccharide biosynthesis protein